MRKIKNNTTLAAYGLAALLGVCTAVVPMLTSAPVQDSEIKNKDYIQEFSKLSSIKITAPIPFKKAITDIKDLKDQRMMDVPTPPAVPSMPAGKGINNIVPGDKLRVVGLLPPNIAILQKSGKTLTVKSGQNSEYGYIGEITSNGVYIDGTFTQIEF